LDREKHGLRKARQGQRAKQAGENAKGNRHHPFREGHLKNVGALCAHGHANADFVGSPAERVGHDAVNPDRSKEKSRGNKDADEFEGKAAFGEERGKNEVHGPNAKSWNGGIHVLDFGADGFGQRAGIGRGAKENDAVVRNWPRSCGRKDSEVGGFTISF